MAAFDLGGWAAQFAGELTDTLNATVCTGIRIGAVVSAPGRAVVGYKLRKDDLESAGIPITRGKKPLCHLYLSYRLQADAEQKFLAVESSVLGLFLDKELNEALLHYDFERGKGDGYPEAHLQVHAGSSAWIELAKRGNKPDRALAKLHLPVGGRRYRPSLEDVIEFLCSEGLADAQDGWREHLHETRTVFQTRQLKAAVRRDPESAVATLREEGWSITPPPVPAPVKPPNRKQRRS